MTIALIITNLVTLALLAFLRYRYGKLLRYTRKSDAERLHLASENADLREAQEYISFKIHGPVD